MTSTAQTQETFFPTTSYVCGVALGVEAGGLPTVSNDGPMVGALGFGAMGLAQGYGAVDDTEVLADPAPLCGRRRQSYLYRERLWRWRPSVEGF